MPRLSPPFLELGGLSLMLAQPNATPVARWGMGLSCTLTSDAVPCPPPDPPRQKRANTILFKAERPEAAIFEHKVEGGINPYLLVSYPLTTGWTLPRHEEALYTHEPSSSCNVHWCGSVPGSIVWNPWHSGHQCRISFVLTEEWMNELWSRVGDPQPDGAGHWLAARLQPRRRPCTIRYPDPLHLQLFIPLFPL